MRSASGMKKQSRFRYGLFVVWPSLFVAIATNTIGIFTLGYYIPSWDISVMWFLSEKFGFRS